MRAKLTKRLVDRIVPAASDVFVWDTVLSGFGMKLTPSGARIYVVQYRLGGRGSLSRRFTIGKRGTLTLDEARSEARKVLGDHAKGQDPVAQKIDARREQIFKLLLITGQRRDEVASMRWRDIDVEQAIWRIPRELNKSRREHVVPLSLLARTILGMCTVESDTLVFPARGNAANHASGFSKAKLRIDRTVVLDPNWRLHDLRRTAASGMARLGAAPHVVEKILNHSSGTISGVAAIYNPHKYLAEKAAALELWSHHVLALTGRKDFPLRKPSGQNSATA